MTHALPISIAYAFPGSGPKAERRQAIMAWCLSLVLRGMVLLGGGYLLWRSGFDGRTGWELFAGLGLLGAAGMMRVPLLLIIPVSMAWSFHHFLFLLWLFRSAAGMTWAKTAMAYAGAVAWEAVPVTAALVVGIVIARRAKTSWAVLLVTAGVWTGLSCWLPRPYSYAPAAQLFSVMPGVVWAFGTDLAGGLLLGWTLMVLRWMFRPTSSREVLVTLLATLGCMGILTLAYEQWINRCSSMARETIKHDVIAIPGAMPPFAANFALQSERIIYPMVFNSSLLPDLVMAPENMVQVNPAVDPQDDQALLQRTTTAIGIGIGVPYSQALYGVRDFQTSRIYFTDLRNDKPRVMWKDMERRVPGIDYPIPWIQKKFHSGAHVPAIRRAEQTPVMNIWKRRPLLDKDSSGNLEQISSALICMSGEIRDPRLVLKVLKSNRLTAIMNPNISGWLGLPEGLASSVQAKSRCLELGMLGYRVGQNSGTELVVPWSMSGIPVSMDPQKTFLRFEAPLPRTRLETWYVLFGYQLALYGMPAVGFITLVLLTLGSFSKTRRYGLA